MTPETVPVTPALAATPETAATRWWPLRYRPAWLGSDLIAGLSTAAVVIPQAMAYAAVAGLPVQVGLYTACVPMVAYALAGTSRPLSVSVTSSIAAVTATAVAGLPDPVHAASALALFSGIVLVLGFFVRLGFVADLISAPVLAGFKVGIGISIAVGQLHSLLGVPVPGSRVSVQLAHAITTIPHASMTTLGLSVGCVVVLLLFKRFVPKIPGSLVVVVGTILGAWIWHWGDHGITLTNKVPSGFPAPALPHLSGTADLIVPALGIALIAFVESTAAARAFVRPGDQPLDATREMGALGLANLVSPLFGGMPAGGGMSQTAVNDGAGAKSPLAGVWSAVALAVTLLFLAPVFSYLPQAALGALVFVAAIGLVDVGSMRRIFVVHRRDGLLAVLAALAVIASGALDGILAAVLISVLTLLFESSRRPLDVLTTVPAVAVPTESVPAGMVVIRPRSDIYFANVQRFRRDVERAVAASDPKPSVVLIDGSGLGLFEYTAHQVMADLAADLRRRGIEVWGVRSRQTEHSADAGRRFAASIGGERAREFSSAAAAIVAFRHVISPAKS